MAEHKTYKTRVMQKIDTADRWSEKNPVLLRGELVIVETEDGKVRMKAGNGTSTFNDLPFVDGEGIVSLPEDLVYASEDGSEDTEFQTYDPTIIVDEPANKKYRLSMDNGTPYLKYIEEAAV